MPDPSITQPDLCSIRGTAQQAKSADAPSAAISVRAEPVAERTRHESGYLNPHPCTAGARLATGHRGQRTGQDDDVLTAAPASYRTAAASPADRVIRLSTAAAVLAVAAVAAYVSYLHAYAVVRQYGENGITARLEPATIDGLVYASSMVILDAARHQVPVPRLARWLLGLGITATLTVNMAQGWSHGPIGAVVAAWPAASLAGSYELLVWLIRSSGTPEPEPPAQRRCENTDCRAARSSAPAAIADGERHGGGIREADAADDAAVAACRLSVQAGNPLSERKLAQMFGRTSRRWARARITQARQPR